MAQVIRKIYKRDAVCIDNFVDKKIYFKKEHYDGSKSSLFGSNAKQYKEVYLPGYCLKVSSGNNCVKIDNDIGLVKNIITVDIGYLYTRQTFYISVEFQLCRYICRIPLR